VATAVDRVSKAIEAIAAAGQAKAADLAVELGMSRQAVARLLEDLVDGGLVLRNDDNKTYSLGLRIYSWGSQAVARYLPAMTTRLAIRRLALETPHPVFYMTRQGEWTYTIERTVAQGEQIDFKPAASHNHWSNTTTGRLLVAFSPAAERERLLNLIARSHRNIQELRQELEQIAERGFAETHTTPIRYTVAAPVLDDRGFAMAAVAIVVANYAESEREQLIGALKDTAARCAAELGSDLMALVP
jgi:DNA-binding IclR family transcriptional regulator